MKCHQAISNTKHWVGTNMDGAGGFAGAFLTGSVIWKDPDDDLPDWSDVDVKIVIDGQMPDVQWGKRPADDLLLDVSPIPLTALSDPDAVLAHFQLAQAFSKDTVLSDPTGQLTGLRDYVMPRFRNRETVLQRVEGVRALTKMRLDQLPDITEPHDLLTGFLFAAGGHAHLILTLACRNPTVRRRWADCGDVLAAIGRNDLQDRLLTASALGHITEPQARDHLTCLADAFDLAAATMRSPYRFAADMTADARPVAIDGAAEMIDGGQHREAMYWIAAMMCRCRAVIAVDATDKLPAFDDRFQALMADLELPDRSSVLEQAEQVRADGESLQMMLADLLIAFDGLDA